MQENKLRKIKEEKSRNVRLKKKWIKTISEKKRQWRNEKSKKEDGKIGKENGDLKEEENDRIENLKGRRKRR